MSKIFKASLSIILVFCLIGGIGLFNNSRAHAADVTIKLAHAASAGAAGSVEEAWSRVFKTIVEAETQGEVEVKIYPGEQLGNQRSILEKVQLGNIEMGSVATAVLGLFYDKAPIFEIPFAFENAEEVFDFSNTQFVEEWADDCAKETGIRPLAQATYGFRMFTNNVRPIKSPEDLEGLKIRVMENKVYIEMMKALGANPTPISVGELYSALQTGVVDGEENPPAVILLHSFHEVQKYLTNMGYVAGVNQYIINDDFYQSLDPEYKDALAKAKKIANDAALGYNYIANYGIGIDKLSSDMEVYTPTQEQVQAFKDIMQPVALSVLEEDLGEEYLSEVMESINSL